MKEGKGNVVLLTIISIITLLISVVGATFAYFTAVFTEDNNEEIRLISGSIGTVFDGGDVVLGTNITPQSPDEDGNYPMATDKPKIFTLKHKSDTIDGVKVVYNVNLVISKSGFAEDSLKYKLFVEDDTTENGKRLEEVSEMANIPNSGTLNLGEGYFISPTNGEAIHKYRLEFYYPSNGNQNEEQGANFSAKITIEVPDQVEQQ